MPKIATPEWRRFWVIDWFHLEMVNKRSTAVRGWLRGQIKPFSMYGTIGIFAALIDIVLFNLLLFVFTNFSGTSMPIFSKIISVSVSTVFAWAGNRLWTFRKTKGPKKGIELGKYFIVAIIGLTVSLIPLWISHYLLGFKSVLADNISANVIGLTIATLTRYFFTRYWVFNDSSEVKDENFQMGEHEKAI